MLYACNKYIVRMYNVFLNFEQRTHEVDHTAIICYFFFMILLFYVSKTTPKVFSLYT